MTMGPLYFFLSKMRPSVCLSPGQIRPLISLGYFQPAVWAKFCAIFSREKMCVRRGRKEGDNLARNSFVTCRKKFRTLIFMKQGDFFHARGN